MIRLGVDTLCWHLRLEKGAVTLEDVLDEAAGLEAEFVQVNLHHVRDRKLEDLGRLAARADELGLRLLASGDFLGQGRDGDAPALGIGRVHAWLERRGALGSPILRVVSGFYRAELMGQPELIEAERRYVVDVLRGALRPPTRPALRSCSRTTPTSRWTSTARWWPRRGLDGRLPRSHQPDRRPRRPGAGRAGPRPLARAGHVKDYVFESIPTDDGYHRRGFAVRYRYPGEGVADLGLLTSTLRDSLDGRDFDLSVEGLDNQVDVDDQRERLRPALVLLRRLTA